MMHFKYVTEKDRAREKKKTLRNLKESQKTDIVFDGENFYDIGGGHDFVFGFFTSYITKSGVEATEYHSGLWRIGGDKGGEFNLTDGEWVKIEREEPKPSGSFEDVKFPIVRNVPAVTVADKIQPVTPMPAPYAGQSGWKKLVNWLRGKDYE